MLKKALIFLTTALLSLQAYSDYDMDGVEDSVDRCPNTPFNELVDIYGCTIKKAWSEEHFSIIYGIGFSEADYATNRNVDTFSQTLQVDYYYEEFSLQASTSYYNSDDDSGMNDSFLGAYYTLSIFERVSLRLGGGVILPTYDTGFNNNNMDVVASANFSYTAEDINLFGGYSYTVLNDDDIAGVVSYQNTNSYSGGAGFYPLNALYISSYYTNSESIYKDTENIETLTLYTFYSIDKNWFTTFSYTYGLSDTAGDNAVELRLGYYF
ncbi:DUF3187 domain-containing protein [Sulfurimonas sp.]|uniref:thrombospondin type 3 repeat-containing protein n=1 Tax=Sulfurimonas sp. TaxID=2022749 RepID=UPI0025EFAC86|nr:DUF3187 domain-containing protein [Sulfurimonas sp.]MCK9454878.1 DUF3187 domain-containing protein [Sulfurimonas sp.]